MIEQGIVALVQGTPAVAAICTQGGGFLNEIPKGWNETVPTWSQMLVVETPYYGLQYQPGLTKLILQIDCYGLGATSVLGAGPQGADCLTLAYAIDKVLSGFAGVLPDPGTTRVDSCFRQNRKSFFDDLGRTYRVLLEYRVWYYYSNP